MNLVNYKIFKIIFTIKCNNIETLRLFFKHKIKSWKSIKHLYNVNYEVGNQKANPLNCNWKKKKKKKKIL